MTRLIRSTNNANINLTPNGTGYVNISSDFTALNKVSRNIIIGGDFSQNPWQRGTTFAAAATGSYSADRWMISYVTSAVVTMSQQTDAPTVAQAAIYSANCLQCAVTTLDSSIATGDFFSISQRIEGYNFTRIAQRTFTLSFWVKAVKTGIYCVAFTNSGSDRSYVAEYTINSTATWEFKTVTVTASPSAGTWDYTSGIGIRVRFCLAGGATFQTTANAWQTGDFHCTANQVNGLDSTSNTFRLALVQIEGGRVATPFEVSHVSTVLRDCQRYYFKTFAQGTAPAQSAGTTGCLSYRVTTTGVSPSGQKLDFPATMRTTPSTITTFSTSAASADWYNSTLSSASGTPTTTAAGDRGLYVLNPQVAGDSGLGNQIGIHVTCDAEL